MTTVYRTMNPQARPQQSSAQTFEVWSMALLKDRRKPCTTGTPTTYGLGAVTSAKADRGGQSPILRLIWDGLPALRLQERRRRGSFASVSGVLGVLRRGGRRSVGHSRPAPHADQRVACSRELSRAFLLMS
eukprot:SAG31_NODE_1201_length_9418_cov_3.410881_11_plen_131_part_00